jgi:hypothetical protein
MRRIALVLLALAACRPRYGRCQRVVETPGECVRSSIGEDPVESNPPLIHVRFEYTWPRDEVDPTPSEDISWFVNPSRLPLVRDASRDRVKCKRLSSAPGCRASLEVEPSALLAPPAATLVDRDAVCPAAGMPHVTTPPIEEVVLEDLLAPEAGSGWRRTNVMRAGVADAIYNRMSKHVRVTVRDMIRSCTCASGSSEVLLETEVALHADTSEQRVPQGVLLTGSLDAPQGSRLVMWIADRCQVVVEALDDEIQTSDLVAVGDAVDRERLEALCKER